MWKYTWKVRLFGLARIPLIFFCWPRVVALNEKRCEVVIPLGWRTKNHWGSMYFGALAVGADLGGGLFAMEKMERCKDAKLSLVFKDFKANFLKRPMQDVVFICEEAGKIDEQIAEAIRTGERVTRALRIDAYTVKDREHVAEFELGLSLKRR